MDMNLHPEALGALFEMSRDPVLGVDDKQIISFVNPAAAALLGAQAGMKAVDLIPEYVLEDPAEHFVASAQVHDKRANISVTRQDGLTLLCYTFLATDASSITPTPEKALREWSNSLMSVRLAMDALLSHTTKDSADGPLLEYFCSLYRDYYRMKRLCQHMIISSDILNNDLPFAPRTIDLKKLCQELCDTVNHFSDSFGVTLCFHAGDGLFITGADGALIETMLLNILTNSVAHTGKGGVIHLDLSRQGKRFILSIRDPGTGIAAEKLPSVFSGGGVPDLADVNAGAGLGMLIARGVAERHGGALILESRPEHGTTVRISIPDTELNTTELHSPPVADYRLDGLDRVLTEMSTLLDKKFYNKKMFD